jgi:hypothetical protein
MIEITGNGRFKNNPLELQRALEILQVVLHEEPHPHEWSLRYGEIAEAGQRIDAIVELRYEDGTKKRIGVEVESHREGVDRAMDKLQWLITIGKLDAAYVYVRPLKEVHESVVAKVKRIIAVR